MASSKTNPGPIPRPAMSGAARTDAPVASLRDPRLDFFRGMAMIIILFAHTPGNPFTAWIPARWGFSDATEMFVFCSGMASAIAFGRSFERAGFAFGTVRVAYRCWQVYWAHIGLFVVIAAAMVMLNTLEIGTRDYVGQLNLYPFFNDPMAQLLGLLSLSYVPNYFDILPMYLVILAMMPLLIAAYRAHPLLALVLVLACWFLAQDRLLDALGLGPFALSLPAEPWSEREWFFNPFGWQLIFFTGFALMAGWLPAPPVNRWLIGLAIVVVLGAMLASNIAIRAVEREWFGLGFDGNPVIDWRVANRMWIGKTDFGILRYVHFLALAYLAWIAVGEGGRFLRAQGHGIAARAWGRVVWGLTKIGQQSLAVFVFSMVLARLNGVWLDIWGREALWHAVLVNLVGVALLLAVALGVAWIKSQPWKSKRAAIPEAVE